MFFRVYGHKGVIKLVDWYECLDSFILIMERPESSIDLFDYIRESGKMNEPEAKIIFKQVKIIFLTKILNVWKNALETFYIFSNQKFFWVIFLKFQALNLLEWNSSRIKICCMNKFGVLILLIDIFSISKKSNSYAMSFSFQAYFFGPFPYFNIQVALKLGNFGFSNYFQNKNTFNFAIY